MKKLTESGRLELKKPVGKLVQTPEALAEARKAKAEGRLLVSVGDSCAYEFISAGVEPDIVIYDELCGRKPTSEKMRKAISSYGGNASRVRNPAGFISDELEREVLAAIRAGKGKIFVLGEEDLAALPAMVHAPGGSLIAYGQPGQGVVLFLATPAKRRRARGIYARMQEA